MHYSEFAMERCMMHGDAGAVAGPKRRIHGGGEGWKKYCERRYCWAHGGDCMEDHACGQSWSMHWQGAYKRRETTFCACETCLR